MNLICALIPSRTWIPLQFFSLYVLKYSGTSEHLWNSLQQFSHEQEVWLQVWEITISALRMKIFIFRYSYGCCRKFFSVIPWKAIVVLTVHCQCVDGNLFTSIFILCNLETMNWMWQNFTISFPRLTNYFCTQNACTYRLPNACMFTYFWVIILTE